MITDKAKFLNLVCQQKITPALKSYADTILFYYLGFLSANKNNGEISEIGVGGSTYVLTELSELLDKTFFIFDIDKEYTDIVVNNVHFWPGAKLKICIDNSTNLHNYPDIPKLSYCHVDGAKEFDITVSDLQFYLDHLSVNGLICQDDYGNNKWPTVTDAIKHLEQTNKIKIVMIGDSSAWVTKPEYYDYWMDILNNDYEFSLLTALCSVSSSEKLNKVPKYFFLQSIFNYSLLTGYTESEKKYFKNILAAKNHQNYLTMPYYAQSEIGFALDNNVDDGYILTVAWDSIKGPDWPQEAPVLREEIERLPDWIKHELFHVHNFNDLFKCVVKKTNFEIKE